MRSFLFALVVTIAFFFSQLSVSADSKNQKSSQLQQTPDQTWLIEQIIELQAKSAKLEVALEQKNLNANDFKVIDDELQSLKFQLVELKEKLTAQGENQTKELSSYDRRIGDLGFNINAWGFVLSIFALILTFSAIVVGIKVKQDAKSEANEVAKDYLDSEGRAMVELKANDLINRQEIELSNFINNWDLQLITLKNELFNQGRKVQAQTLFDRARDNDSEGNYWIAIAGYDELIAFIGSATDSSSKEFAARALYFKGLCLCRLNIWEGGIQCFDELINYLNQDEDSALRELVTKALFQKADAQRFLNLYEESVTTYDRLIAYTVDDKTDSLREHTASAMYQKGFCQDKIHQPEKSIRTYHALISYVADDKSRSLRILAGKARNGIAFILIRFSKQHFSKGEINEANNLLIQALDILEIALTDWPSGIKLGNKAYILSLLDRQIESEQLFGEALRALMHGGEELYKATLGDFEITPIEQDTPFRGIVERQWALYQEEIKNG